MLVTALALALDTADTGDTGPYIDTATRAERVYTHPDEGCGGGASAVVAALLLLTPTRGKPARR